MVGKRLNYALPGMRSLTMGGGRAATAMKKGPYKEAFVAREIPMVGFGTVNSVALSGDKDQRFLYVCEGHQQRVRVLDRKTLEEIPQAAFGHVGQYPGMFLGLHIIATDAKGNIYTGDGRDGRVQKFNFTGLAQ